MMLLRQQFISKCNLFHSQENSDPSINSKQDKIAILIFNSQTVDKTEFIFLSIYLYIKLHCIHFIVNTIGFVLSNAEYFYQII